MALHSGFDRTVRLTLGYVSKGLIVCTSFFDMLV